VADPTSSDKISIPVQDVPPSSLSYLVVMAITRSPYKGRTRKLVLAFDIGTTYSGVSYVLLDPGLVPEVQSVGR